MVRPGLLWPPKPRPGWVLAFVAAASLALLGAAAAAAWRWRRSRRRPVGRVSALFIYPVKSCRGVAVEQAEVTRLGLRSGEMRDRCWLVIKEDGHMVTARQEPRLVLISIASENDCLTLSAPEMKDIHIPARLSARNPVKNCRLFGTDIQGRDCGEEAAQWITDFLKSEPYRLVQFESNMVPRNAKDLMEPFRPNDKIAYPDCSPIMVLSEASLEELNSRLQKKVQIRNFRPNILVTGCNPHEEVLAQTVEGINAMVFKMQGFAIKVSWIAKDTWDEIKIGDVEMKGAAACPRCIFTTIDPDTGIMDRKEPLETLKSYRLCDPSEQHIYKSHPLFGWYFGVDKTGTIQVGDIVYKMI